MKPIPWHLLSVVAPITVLLTSCDTESTTRTDRPVTKTKAEATLHTPLPTSAREVYYLSYVGGMQDHEWFLRFDVASEALESAVAELIADNEKQQRRSIKHERVELAAAEPSNPRPEFLPMTWWEPSAIRHGYVMETPDKTAYSLRIWVDQDQARIYVYQND